MTAQLLIAEDEPMIARILVDKLRREGHAVQRLSTAADLHTVLADCDVALVDVSLEEDGVEVMQRLSSTGTHPRVGWFAMVEARDPAAGARAVQAGAAGIVVKPFKPTAVAAQVQTLLAAVATTTP